GEEVDVTAVFEADFDEVPDTGGAGACPVGGHGFAGEVPAPGLGGLPVGEGAGGEVDGGGFVVPVVAVLDEEVTGDVGVVGGGAGGFGFGLGDAVELALDGLGLVDGGGAAFVEEERRG